MSETDIVGLTQASQITDFHERAVPMLLDPINSSVPAVAVLELNGGTVARLGIKRGDHVHHAMFGNAP